MVARSFPIMKEEIIKQKTLSPSMKERVIAAKDISELYQVFFFISFLLFATLFSLLVTLFN